jgi:flagellar biosynthesis/type III secretory pathway M-ring protein FliF/YscJ
MASLKTANSNKWFKENSIVIVIVLVLLIITFFIIRSIFKSVVAAIKRKKTKLPLNPETGVELTEEEVEMTFDVDKYVEIFRKTTDTCWVTCFHRCPNFEILYKELDSAQLVHTNNKYLKKYNKTMIEEMKEYDIYGCDFAHGYPYTNYGTLLFDKLTSLGVS